ncbi:MAG TPA: hypothetical protein VET30_11415, partial [Pseudoxanthomonas sp.]|nr:hypothetical protein [Pseudoxanthomonas sp.]
MPAWSLLLALALAGDLHAEAPAAMPSLKVPVRIELLDTDSRAHVNVAGDGVVLPADGRPARFRLHFALPLVQGDSSPWQLRFNRAPVDGLRLSRAEWKPPAQSYYYPRAHDGLLPMAFMQSLPTGWSGETTLDVEARASQLATLRPQVVRMAFGHERDQ